MHRTFEVVLVDMNTNAGPSTKPCDFLRHRMQCGRAWTTQSISLKIIGQAAMITDMSFLDTI